MQEWVLGIKTEPNTVKDCIQQQLINQRDSSVD